MPQPETSQPAQTPTHNAVEDLADPLGSAPVIQPLYVKQLAESPQLTGVIVSPDGNSLYATVVVPVIDMGALFVAYSRPVVDGLLGLLALPVLFWLWRAARRRRKAGACYCGKCDYELTSLVQGSQTPSNCPECGADLAIRKPVAGMSPARRLAWPAALLALLIGAAAWFELAGRTRIGDFVPRERWASRWLSEYGSTRQIVWPKGVEHNGDLLLELDTQTGEVVRTITQRASRSYSELAYNPAADGVYLKSGEGTDLVSLRTGRVIASLRGCFGRVNGPLVIGHSPDARLVYLDSAEMHRDATANLVEWDWSRGTSRTIATAEPFRDKGRDVPRHFAMVPGEPLRFVRYSDFSEAFPTAGYSVALLDSDGKMVNDSNFGQSVQPSGNPAFSTDGALMFLASHHQSELFAYEIPSLKEAAILPFGSGSALHGITVRADGRLLLIPRLHSIAVRDTVGRSWAALLTHPPTVLSANPLSFSGDGLTVATVTQGATAGGGGRGGPFAFWLAVWRLPDSLAVTPPGAKGAGKETP